MSSFPAQGILLNPIHAFYLSPPTPPHKAPSSASSSSSTESYIILPDAHSTRHNSSSSSRKIRFAPLPDPRKLDDLDNGSVTSLSESGFDDPDPPGSSCASPAKALLDLPCFDKNNQGSAPSSIRSIQSNRTASWTKKLFGPLLAKSSTRNDDNLGSLFRSESRDSVRSIQSADTDATSVGHSITRRFSTGSSIVPNFRSDRDNILSKTSPLAPSISEGGTSRSRRTTRPQAMLNGRVYGRHRGALTPDPFQNQRPAHEPEFVEWGYGGMGSVPSAKGTGHAPGKSAAAADWARLQSGNKVFGSESNQDDDDGSGMGWVRRRREQREREAREAAKVQPTPVDLPDAKEAVVPLESTPPLLSESEGVEENNESPSSPEHDYKAIKVPAPPHYHGHPHPHALPTPHDHKPSENITPTISRASTIDAINFRHSLPEPLASSPSSETSSTVNDEGDEEESEEDNDDEDEEDDAEVCRHLCALRVFVLTTTTLGRKT